MDERQRINSANIQHYNINLTDECNLRCYYCFTHHNPAKMSLETAKQVILFGLKSFEQAETKRGPVSFTFFGGEPTLRFEDIIRPILKFTFDYCCENGYDEKDRPFFTMTTNGILLDEERLQFLASCPFNFTLLLSIDGDKESQNHNRPCANGGESFDKVAKNIPLILKYFPKTTFRSTLTPFTVDKMIDNYFFAKDCGFESIFFTPNESEEWSEEDQLKVSTYASLLCQVISNEILSGEKPLWFSPLMQMCRTLIQPEPFEKTLHRCGLGSASVGVTCDGRFSACQELSTFLTEDNIFYIGDIHNGVNVQRREALFDAYLKDEHINNPNQDCINCPLYEHCNRQNCPARNFGLCGDINQVTDISCFWKKVLYFNAQELIKIAAETNSQTFYNMMLFGNVGKGC